MSYYEMTTEGNINWDEVGNCCAIASVEGFYFDEARDSAKEKDQILSSIKSFLDDASKEGEEAERSMLFATVNDRQLLSEQALIESGFVSMFPDWSERNPKHAGQGRTKVKVYMKQLYKPEGV